MPAQAIAESLAALNALETMGMWSGPRDEITELVWSKSAAAGGEDSGDVATHGARGRLVIFKAMAEYSRKTSKDSAALTLIHQGIGVVRVGSGFEVRGGCSPGALAARKPKTQAGAGAWVRGEQSS